MIKPISTLLCLFALIATAPMIGQNYEFGQVSTSEVASKRDGQFPEANAAVLYRYVNNYIGNFVEVHERIKIYNKEGFDHATIRIPYTDVDRVKGITYNMEDGQVVSTELDDDLIFTDEVVKGIDIKKFTFPNIREGSVIEVSYRSKKGTIGKIGLQYDIPIKMLKVKLTDRSEAGFDYAQNPRAFLNMSRKQEGKSTIYTASGVNALEEESYVYDMELYRAYLKINITTLGYDYEVDDWTSLVSKIAFAPDFMRNMRAKPFAKDKVLALINGESDPMKQARIIFNHVKEEITWDKKITLIPDRSVSETYKRKEGSLADINAVLVSALRTLGLEANPVLVSTKLNGLPLKANIEAFNGMIAGVKVGDKIHVMDAASNNSTFNMLDLAFLNWEGMYVDIKEKGYKWVDMVQSKASGKNIIANITIDEDLIASGKVRERHMGYCSIAKTNILRDLGDGNTEVVLDYDKDGLEIMEVKPNTDRDEITDISYAFEWDSAVEEIGDKLYISPLLFFGMEENPFIAETRNYPIDFGFSFKNQFMVNISIPENYKIESVPEKTTVALPDKIGSFVYQAVEGPDKVQVSAIVRIDKPLLQYDQYELIKRFFEVRMAKENEKIVFSKI